MRGEDGVNGVGVVDGSLHNAARLGSRSSSFTSAGEKATAEESEAGWDWAPMAPGEEENGGGKQGPRGGGGGKSLGRWNPSALWRGD